jgi:hypothetical protein
MILFSTLMKYFMYLHLSYFLYITGYSVYFNIYHFMDKNPDTHKEIYSILILNWV